MEWISGLFEQYGYFVLFAGLFAESMALPFPGELAMAISGHMTNLGSFGLLAVIFYSYIGAIAGTTLTYYLGWRLGPPFFEKYGKYLLLNPDRLAKITKWFDKYGDKLIFVSYYIPGLRHFTGYVSGMLRIRLRTFLIYNYIGGFLWTVTYVMVGKIFGKQIEQLLHLISQYSIAAVIVIAIAVAVGFAVKQNKEAIAQWAKSRFKPKKANEPTK